MTQLVLSLFPGIGLLDMAFEEEGFCVVRGPDLLWGGDIRRFHPPAGKFDGVIGGPPCQAFSPIGNVNKARWGADSVMPDLIPEFARVVREASPSWWVMENSPNAYAPFPVCRAVVVDLASLGYLQRRVRRFWSNLRLVVETPVLVSPDAGRERTVASHTVDWRGSRKREGERGVPSMLELQGLPADFFEHTPFTVTEQRRMVANGVPLPMGRAVARAVKRALGLEEAA